MRPTVENINVCLLAGRHQSIDGAEALPIVRNVLTSVSGRVGKRGSVGNHARKTG
jgi:hypothetical protein